jgi:transposase
MRSTMQLGDCAAWKSSWRPLSRAGRWRRGGGLSSDAGRLVPGRGDLRRRDRRFTPLRYAAAVDGVSRLSPGRALNRRQRTTQGTDPGRQSTRASGIDRRPGPIAIPPGSARPSARLEGLPKAVRDIARKGQVRLCARYRRLSAAGKKLPVVVAAIAREMAAFLWAIGREIAPV